jgi:hypothetical protein
MKNINNTEEKCSFSSSVRKLLSGWFKHQNCNYLKEIFEKLQDIDDKIEIIAREVARQAKQRSATDRPN